MTSRTIRLEPGGLLILLRRSQSRERSVLFCWDDDIHQKYPRSGSDRVNAMVIVMFTPVTRFRGELVSLKNEVARPSLHFSITARKVFLHHNACLCYIVVIYLNSTKTGQLRGNVSQDSPQRFCPIIQFLLKEVFSKVYISS